MTKFLLDRLTQSLVVLLVMSFVIYGLIGLMPGDPIAPCRVRLGTTVATNALLERRGARTVLVASDGLSDVIEIGTQERPELFDLEVTKPAPLLERSVFWCGSGFMIAAFPITVPLWFYYQHRVRSTGMIGLPTRRARGASASPPTEAPKVDSLED